MPRCDHQWFFAPPLQLPVCVRCGREPTASPSQVETWRDCQRKWAYSRVRTKTEHPFAAYGTRCHQLLEDWLIKRIPPPNDTPEGKTVWTGLHLIPTPWTPGLGIEERATPVLGGPPLARALGLGDDALGPSVAWDMRKDFRYGYTPENGGVLVIGDHKTTGDIAEYAKTAETLSTTDPQGIAYTHDSAEHYDVAWVVGQWVYYQRDAKAKAKPVTFTISRQQARERFARMHVEEVVPMVRARAAPIESLPRNLDACNRYGGCPYQRECHATITPEESAATLLTQIRGAARPMPETPADLLASIAAAAGNVPPPPTTAAAPTPEPIFVAGKHTTGDPKLDAHLGTLAPADQAALLSSVIAAQAAAGLPLTVVSVLPEAPPVVETRAPKKRQTKPKAAPKVEVEPPADVVLDQAVEAGALAAAQVTGDFSEIECSEQDERRYQRRRLVEVWLRGTRPKEDLEYAITMVEVPL